VDLPIDFLPSAKTLGRQVWINVHVGKRGADFMPGSSGCQTVGSCISFEQFAVSAGTTNRFHSLPVYSRGRGDWPRAPGSSWGAAKPARRLASHGGRCENFPKSCGKPPIEAC